MPTNKHVLQIVVDDETYKIIEENAKKENRSKSNFVDFIIKEYIKTNNLNVK